MTELADLFGRAQRQFGALVHQVGDGAWGNGTPCTDWDVRALVNHLVYEARWAPPLLAGATLEEVGDQFEGDLLGSDPKTAYDEATAASTQAARAPGVLERTVHLSYGDVPGGDYVGQMTIDFTVHAWDLARGIGADDTLDANLVKFAWETAEPQKEMLAASGMFAAPIDVPAEADQQTRLLAMFGRKR